jgi:hypothetical protein
LSVLLRYMDSNLAIVLSVLLRYMDSNLAIVLSVLLRYMDSNLVSSNSSSMKIFSKEHTRFQRQ